MNPERRSRAETLWRCVMREGRCLEEVAREHEVSRHRLEQLLLAFGRRRARRMGWQAA
jgi:hypothetical protein